MKAPTILCLCLVIVACGESRTEQEPIQIHINISDCDIMGSGDSFSLGTSAQSIWISHCLIVQDSTGFHVRPKSGVDKTEIAKAFRPRGIPVDSVAHRYGGDE